MDEPEKESDIEVLATVPKNLPTPPVTDERDNDPPDVVSLGEKLFQTSIDLQESKPDTSRTPYTYPEAILQQTDNANRYYFQFQSFQRQFIQEDQDSLNKSMRWSLKSKIQQTLKKIIEDWLISEQKGRTIETENEVKKVLPANTLFSWSSGDTYIQERRRQIEERKRKSMHAAAAANGTTTKAVNDKKPENDKEHLSKAAKKKTTPKESIASKLNRTIEVESNKFIHARIQKIKAHHNEQISKKIHERKRKDHENHLMRLKVKEEEYEKGLLMNTSLKQGGGFFGTIFGFNNNPSGSKKEIPEGSDLNGASSITDKRNSRPATPVDLAFEASTPRSTSSTTSTATSTAPEPKVSTSSSSKNKRFSFLPKGTMWNSDVNQDLKKGNEQAQPVELLEGTVFDQDREHEEHQTRISESKGKSHTNSPSLASGVLTPTVLTPTVLTPTVLTPTVLTPTKKGFDIGSLNNGAPAHKQEAKFVANNTNAYISGNSNTNDDDDDDDDFSDFTSSVPLPVPQPASQLPQLAPSNNRFMAVHTSNINRDLLDLFGNDQHQQQHQQQGQQQGQQTNTHQAQKNAQVEDLLSL